MPVKSGQEHLNLGMVAMSQNGGDYAYWDNSQAQETVYPMPMNNLVSKEESLLEAVRSLQESMQQKALRPAPTPPSSSAIALPGTGLTVTVETDTARLKITFESK